MNNIVINIREKAEVAHRGDKREGSKGKRRSKLICLQAVNRVKDIAHPNTQTQNKRVLPNNKTQKETILVSEERNKTKLFNNVYAKC